MKLALVGDIGGTNARFALWEDDSLHSVRVFPTADYSGPEEAIELYLKDLQLPSKAIGSPTATGA
jgi:glucokinase